MDSKRLDELMLTVPLRAGERARAEDGRVVIDDPERLAEIVCVLRDDTTLTDKSRDAIEDVLRVAREMVMNEPRWYVQATVSTWVHAPDKGEAMQELCNRLAHGVPDEYGVNTVTAIPADTVEDTFPEAP